MFVGEAAPAVDLAAVGWVEEEFVATGTATAYTSEAPQPTDGRFEVTEAGTADYRTRILVRRPADPAEFDGTVVVEWFNVSGGLDAGPDWTFAAEEIVRSGGAWVGVSAQHIGVEGGEVLVTVGSVGDGVVGKGLKGIDPERYGSLAHPGDAFAYDIFTQVGRAVRAEGSPAMGGLGVERVLAIGESQSAFALTTYANAVQPLEGAYDGFLVHSRAAAALPLGEPGTGISMSSGVIGDPVLIRTDLDVPVLILETEGDLASVLDYQAARQDDTDRIRTWEVAGTAHADRTILGPTADAVDCGVPINDGPQRFAVRAAVRALDTWVRTGEPPAAADRIALVDVDGSPAIDRDADGNALGGLRLPQIEVPVATLSGDPGPVGLADLPAARVHRAVHPGAPGRALPVGRRLPARPTPRPPTSAIAAGFALAEDRQQILDDADPAAISG